MSGCLLHARLCHAFLVFVAKLYYRSCLWHDVSSVCLSVVCLTFCIVAKRYVLAKKCLKEQIGNQGQRVDFLGRRRISTSGFAYMVPRRPFLPYGRPNLALAGILV